MSNCFCIFAPMNFNVVFRVNPATYSNEPYFRLMECTNRQLKTDLNLRPIFHQKDDRSDAHLFLGLLSYWIVNTIRHKLKQPGLTSYWTEIMRRLPPQEAITTEATNALGEKIRFRQCTNPSQPTLDIYQRLNYRPMPFKKIKLKKSL